MDGYHNRTDPTGRVVPQIHRARWCFGLQRHEGHDVDDPETGMDALVGAQVQGFEGFADQCADVMNQ